VKILTSRNPAPIVASIFFAMVFALVLINTRTAFAKSENQLKDNAMAKKALHVVSDKMIAQKNNSMVEFIGNVKATMDDSIIFADSIKIFIHTPDTRKKGQSNLKKIIASGNVVYKEGERKAFADKAVYTAGDEILILTGKAAKLVTGKSHVTGNKITLFRHEDRAIVESDGKTRVQAIFDPEDQKKGNAQ